MNREQLYSGLLAFFSALTVGGSPAFKVATRKATTWDNVAPEDQPALLLMQRTEGAEYRKGLPTKWRLGVSLYVYIHTGAQNDPAIIPSQILNPLLDAVQAALTIDDPFNDACTLGGLVSHCAIEGSIEIFEGVLGDELVAIVPITMLIASN